MVCNEWIFDNLLEVGFDDIFKNILSLTKQAIGSRFSQINIIGQEKHWRISDTGIRVEPCDNTTDFIDLALRENRTFEIENILEDKRITNKQLIINGLLVRSFTAIPLILPDSSVIGSISIMDCEPSKLTSDKQSLLTLLAQNAASQINLYLKNHQSNKDNLSIAAAESTVNLAALKNKHNSDLDEFAHYASHDLKAPLNVIKNISSWIEEDILKGNTEDNSKHFSMIKTSVNRMHQLLTDLRKYSKIGQEIYLPENFNLKSLLEGGSQDVADKRHFDIVSESCDINLPKAPCLFVLNQLISNAIKHHHKQKGVINVSCKSQLKHYQLTVTDDGPGIPIKLQNKIFKAFQKLTSQDETEGSGLGLTMVRKTLALYSAEISVDSHVGIGTTFTVIWPKNTSDKQTTSINFVYKEKH